MIDNGHRDRAQDAVGYRARSGNLQKVATLHDDLLQMD